MELTERQQNELEYHRQHAVKKQQLLTQPFSWDVLDKPCRRWWNAYWSMYAQLARLDLAGKRVLVVGCGYGKDALPLAKLGAAVHAFDLSPDLLSIARALAKREGLHVVFEEMPAESLTYDDNYFDTVVAADIMHHVDIQAAMGQIQRVARPGAVFVMNEVYSHSITNLVRRSVLVEKVLYPRMRRFIYGSRRPYISPGERKLNEGDVRMIAKWLSPDCRKEYYYCFVTRLVPARYVIVAKCDRLLLILLRLLAPVLGGRVLVVGNVAKSCKR